MPFLGAFFPSVANATSPTITEHTLSNDTNDNYYDYHVTTGSDGALWFTDPLVTLQQGAVGRMSPSGDVSYYSLPSGSMAGDITSGPDGALWFGMSGGYIGRMTTSGDLTEYSIGAYGASAITSGPDDSLWFVESDSSGQWSIGSITTSGTVTHYTDGAPTGDENSSIALEGIAAGSDGALWFTEEGNSTNQNAIGKMTTSGTYTEYPTPTTTSFPYSITAGPDGAL